MRSIARNGTHAQFVLVELGNRLPVEYAGVEPPPDTFKDDAQALAIRCAHALAKVKRGFELRLDRELAGPVNESPFVASAYCCESL